MSEKTKPDDGGQAFPRAAGPSGSNHCNGELGMTLRDYFAAKALAAIIQIHESSRALRQFEAGQPEIPARPKS